MYVERERDKVKRRIERSGRIQIVERTKGMKYLYVDANI